MRDAAVGGTGMTGARRRSCARARRAAMRSGARSWIGARGDSLSICPGVPAGGRAYWRARPNARVRVLRARTDRAPGAVCEPERSRYEA